MNSKNVFFNSNACFTFYFSSLKCYKFGKWFVLNVFLNYNLYTHKRKKST